MLKLYITLLALLVTVAPQAAYIAGDVFIATDTSGTNAVPTNTFNITSTNAALVGTLSADSGIFTNSVTSGNSGYFGFGTGRFYLDAANTVAQRNGTSAQTFNLYNTFTDASNYERGRMIWSGNVFQIDTGSAGTGVARVMRVGTSGSTSLQFLTANTLRWTIDASGNLIANSDNTYDIGASGATRPRNYFGAGNGTFGGVLISSTGTSQINQVQVASGNAFLWSGRSRILSTSDGAVSFRNNADTANAALTFGTLTLTPSTANTTALTISGGSNTGSDVTPFANWTHTWNTSGNAIGFGIDITDTASGASSLPFRIRGGSGGTTELFSVGRTGVGTFASSVFTANGNGFFIGTRGSLRAIADGQFRLVDNAGTGFTSFTTGADDASPNNGLIDGASGVGTDIAGGSLTIAGGQSTGTGRGGAVIIQTSPSGSTGSSANAYSERAHYAAKAVTLTEATATTVATIAVPAAKYVGAQFVVTVFATDGTDHQARTLRFGVSAINKAGTVTAAIDTPDESIAVSAGTLTATITAVANGNAVDVKVDSTSSLTQTTLSAKVAITGINSNDTAAVTEI